LLLLFKNDTISKVKYTLNITLQTSHTLQKHHFKKYHSDILALVFTITEY
jgi:hypothetical protein